MSGEEPFADANAEFDAAIAKVLDSASRKKLVVAGPGAGKTTLFQKVLESLEKNARNCLALTFINNLKDDLEQELAGLARVSTLHAYCLGLLGSQPALRQGLSSEFRCCPGLRHLIKADWRYLQGPDVPKFVDEMRNLQPDNHLAFYMDRAHYYDAVDFDDMVYRVCQGFSSGEAVPDSYDLVLIDEYQDFNRLEAGFIGHLGTNSPILIAGDDDQALYSRLRSSSCEYIRLLHAGEEFEVFELPFCLRCPEVVVEAVGDVIQHAQALGKLQGRIPKPYRYFPPAKESDSTLYPKIRVVKTSVQREGAANYMGRYIEQAIRSIPAEEIQQAAEKGYPYALVIASDPYRRQVVSHLRDAGFVVDTKRDEQESLSRDVGLAILQEDERANLGWRILVELDSPAFLAQAIRETTDGSAALVDVLPEPYRESVLAEVEAYVPPDTEVVDQQTDELDAAPRVQVTSYEGAKGLSAQHVFMVGLHDGDMPSHPDDIQDLEICRFIVGLTRTRKSCTLIHTGLFLGRPKARSSFIGWVASARLDHLWVNKQYWD